jgi:uncharacterized protein Yka (UPF0111/DUF47 family)
MRRWFMHEPPDLIGLLVHQGAVTVDAMSEFREWSGGSAESAQKVRELEHRADSIRRHLETALKRAFSTPIDTEDIYELSERLDRVLNSAKNAIREAEVMAMGPDRHMKDMGDVIAEGVKDLVTAFENLTRDPDEATAAANSAIKCQRSIEHRYRLAMSSLLGDGELGEVMGRRELYRRYARIGDAIEHVADRIWYAIVKVG